MTYFTRKEAMEYLGLKPTSQASFDKLLSNGLPVIKAGIAPRYSKESIDQFMKDHEVKTQKKEG